MSSVIDGVANTKAAQPATKIPFSDQGGTFKDFKLGKPRKHKSGRSRAFTFEHNIESDRKRHGKFPHKLHKDGDVTFKNDHGIAEDAILGNESEGGYGQYSGIIAFHPISKAYKQSHAYELKRGHHRHTRDVLHRKGH